MERETGFEPATSTLARSHSTTELFPPAATLTVPQRSQTDQGTQGRSHHGLAAERRFGADAWVLLADEVSTPDAALDPRERAVRAGADAIGDRFAHLRGEFWGHLETRPYVRAAWPGWRAPGFRTSRRAAHPARRARGRHADPVAVRPSALALAIGGDSPETQAFEAATEANPHVVAPAGA